MTTPDTPTLSTAPDDSGRGFRWLVALIALVSYLPSLSNGIVWDDNQLLASDLITGAQPLWQAFWQDYWSLGRVWSEQAGYYRPLTVLSLRVDYLVGGGNPLPFHLTAVLLHVITSLAIYPLARRFNVSPTAARLASLLFAVHPHHAETVAWISGRPDLLMAATLLWSLATRHRGASLLLGACALLSKETAVVWPVIAAIRDRKVWTRSRAYEVSLVFAYLVVRTLVLEGNSIRTLAADASTGMRALFLLLGTWVWPFATPYAFTPITSWLSGPPLMWVGFVAALALIYLATMVQSSRPALSTAAILHAPAALLMCSTIVVGMRPMYAASAFLCFALAISFARDTRSFTPLARGVTACLTVALALGSASMSQRWRDNLSFQLQAAASSPRVASIQQNLAVAQYEDGLLADSWRTTAHVLTLDAQNPGASFTRGRILESIGCTANAVAEYEGSLSMLPSFAPSHDALFRLHLTRGDRSAATLQWEAAKRAGISLPVPGANAPLTAPTPLVTCADAEIPAHLSDARRLVRQGSLFIQTRRFDLADISLCAALHLKSDDAAAHLAMAQLYFLTRAPSQALTHARAALAKEPELAPAMKILGASLLQIDPQSTEGRALITRYLERTPAAPDAAYLRSLIHK